MSRQLTHPTADPGEAPPEGQELRHLAPLQLAVWYPQHVQGVPRDVEDGCCRGPLLRHGCPPPCSFRVHPRMTDATLKIIREVAVLTLKTDSPRRRAREDRGRQEALYQAAPRQGPQVPPPSPCREEQRQQAVQCQASFDFRLRNGHCFGAGIRQVVRVLLRSMEVPCILSVLVGWASKVMEK